MENTGLPTSTIIKDTVCNFDADYRNIIYIFNIFNDPDLLKQEKVICALENFYTDENYLVDVDTAVTEMLDFISMCEPDNSKQTNEKPLYSWEQDYNIIVAPINKIVGYDVRGKEFLHWWTFLSAFMEIGEGTFNTYVGIRSKLNKGKKLEKYEELIYREHKDKIVLHTKYDTVTQALIDEIMGGI